MSENYKFFNHKNCEYFPCHKTNKPEDFNCLFCYCPLYALGKNCGGNFKYNEKGIKDCSKCLLPHNKNNYDYIMSKFSDIIKITSENSSDSL
ncbi:MAG: cysteine-rich small domain-containing protein [Peptostreptococcaceae bacterium]